MILAKLVDLPEEVIIYLLSFLPVNEILSLRQTCKFLNEITNLSIVWISAWDTQIHRKGYPFPSTTFGRNSVRTEGKKACDGDVRCRGCLDIEAISREELEQRTRHAFRLARKWLYRPSIPRNGPFDATHRLGAPFPLPPCRDIDWVVSPSTPITDVRFVRSVRHSISSVNGSKTESVLVLSVSKGIWSVITIWEVLVSLGVQDGIPPRPRKCAEWSPKGGLFTGLCLATENPSEADLAVSVMCEGRYEINLFSISDSGELLPLCTIPAVPIRTEVSALSEENAVRLRAMQPMKPMTLSGNVLAMSDDVACTVIYNWKTGEFAILEHEEDQVGVWKQDQIVQVVFAYRSILVVRARSVHLFPEPELCSISAPSQSSTAVGLPVYSPLAKHSFGWVDGVSVVPIYSAGCTRPTTLKILVRLQSDNPWMANEHSLDLYELHSDPDIGIEDDVARSPYLFPPICTAQVASTRGSLRCTDLVLGKCGTAIWVKPGERALNGLLPPEIYDDYTNNTRQGGFDGILSNISGDVEGKSSESLVAGIFPGPLNPQTTVRTRKIYANVLKNWTTLDYDEAVGSIVLGDASGSVRILQL
ncbi:hypothetical protein GYMLUDRAFT_1009574 [Collybiopsis luxurians FD-317 M1]|uniref:F-box domain-containing protein n=1 Tax=Collybiopsis luxurians FD-317 M1 TaxID=944289 RepID=A0A0D0CQD1_9AGAR|nr:hypothetical protein GYMLUDRAFT_1009574 [Collybiopsis luxurians FD-317 M1]